MRRSQCHPLLRGTSSGKFSHGFSAVEMETLATICDTVLPPLPFDSSNNNHSDAAVKAFYAASGSQSPIPDEVSWLIDWGNKFLMFFFFNLMWKFKKWKLGCRNGEEERIDWNCDTGESGAVDSGFEVRDVVALWIALFVREMAFCEQFLGDAIGEERGRFEEMV